MLLWLFTSFMFSVYFCLVIYFIQIAPSQIPGLTLRSLNEENLPNKQKGEDKHIPPHNMSTASVHWNTVVSYPLLLDWILISDVQISKFWKNNNFLKDVAYLFQSVWCEVVAISFIMSSQCSHLIDFFGLFHCLGCGFINGMVAVKSYAMKVAMKMVVSCNPMLSYFYFTNQQKSLLIQNQLTSCAFIQTFWYDTSYYTTTDVQRNEGRTEIRKNCWSVCVCDQWNRLQDHTHLIFYNPWKHLDCLQYTS